MKDKKGLAALLVAAAPKKDEDESSEMDGKSMAVEDLMKAFEDKDAEGVKAALEAFVEACY